MKRTFYPALVALVALGSAGSLHAGDREGPAWASAVVAVDGSGQFRSLQAAIAAAPTATRDRPWVIYVKSGVYKERIYVQREKRFLRLVGDDPEKTVVSFDLHANLQGLDGKPIGTFATATATIDADDFSAENLTFENPAGLQGQALALRVDGDRVWFRNCRFVGWQDTVFLNRGRQYFEDCFVSGHVDFIFGGATAFFERCRILARRDGYVTAASTPQEQPHGFVFSHCTIRGETAEVRTWLGRPWRSYSSVIFLDTDMSEVVRPAGWHNWDQPDREKTARYAERACTGPGARPTSRVAWSRQLSAAEAATVTVRSVLAGHDGWDPLTAGARAARPSGRRGELRIALAPYLLTAPAAPHGPAPGREGAPRP
ncbi:MAG TPA: pectinesterase family protein [Vicinamibacteria bacterium]|nr:pectinesterase family protein [Vicinamibacteria bacterium]